MANFEKVKKGIECCICLGETRGACSPECPYETLEQQECWVAMNKDALELLKEQQAEIDRLKDEKGEAHERGTKATQGMGDIV